MHSSTPTLITERHHCTHTYIHTQFGPHCQCSRRSPGMSSNALSMTVNNSQNPIMFQRKKNFNVLHDQFFFKVIYQSPDINQTNPTLCYEVSFCPCNRKYVCAPTTPLVRPLKLKQLDKKSIVIID